MAYERIMVFGAHPDDEMVMAGTMAKLAEAGVRVTVVQMTDGCEGYPRPEWRDDIVEMRRREADAANVVLGVAERYHVGSPDMGLVNDKATLKACIRIIRAERPQAIFTHGPDDRHRDHVATHHISVEAHWHAGEPVGVELGEPWAAPYLYYHKAVGDARRLPRVEFEVTGHAHKQWEALATQISQHELFEQHWGTSGADLVARAEELKAKAAPAEETFWIAEANTWPGFPEAPG